MTRGAWAAQCAAAALLLVLTVAACDGDTAGDVVGAADAITAIVAWQAGEQEPVISDDGELKLPVIFVVADGGAMIDVGVQAEVAEATADWATVRFADDVSDTFDPGLEGEPVRDEGAMLLLGPIPEPERRIELDMVRYTAADDGEPFRLEITSNTSTVGTGPDPAPRASVTAVTQP